MAFEMEIVQRDRLGLYEEGSELHIKGSTGPTSMATFRWLQHTVSVFGRPISSANKNK